MVTSRGDISGTREGYWGPLFVGLAASDAGRLYVGGAVYNGGFRMLVSAWDAG